MLKDLLESMLDLEDSYETPVNQVMYFEAKPLATGVTNIDVRKATIKWKLDMEVRDWGVKDVYVEIISVSGDLRIEHEDGSIEEQEFTYSDSTHKIKADTTDKETSGIFPTYITINDSSKEIEIEFAMGI